METGTVGSIWPHHWIARLPPHQSSMLPNISNFSSKYSDKLVERHDAQLQHDTQGHTLKELPVGITLGYCDHANNQFHVGIV